MTAERSTDRLPEWTEDSFRRHADERRRRPHRQPARPRRHQLHRRRRLRLLAGRRQPRRPRPAGGHARHGDRRRRRRDPESVRVPLLQQDAGAVAHRPLPPLRRRGRRHRDQRGLRRRGPQAAGRRRARRRPHLRRHQGRRRRQRRPGPQPDRAAAGGPDARRCAARTPRPASPRRRSAWSRPTAPARWPATGPRSSRCRRVFSEARRRPAVVRDRLGQVDDRPHQGGGRRRRADQGRARAAPPGAAADAGRDGAEPEGRLPLRTLLRQHRGAALDPRRAGEADGADRPDGAGRAGRASRGGPASARSASAGPTSTSSWRSTPARWPPNR